MFSDQNLIWVDMEMTGLDPDKDVVIEIATIVTDSDLNTLAEGPVLAIYQPDERLDAMDEWNTSHHTSSGLVKRVRSSDGAGSGAGAAKPNWSWETVAPSPHIALLVGARDDRHLRLPGSRRRAHPAYGRRTQSGHGRAGPDQVRQFLPARASSRRSAQLHP